MSDSTDFPPPTSIGEDLPRQIERVRGIRDFAAGIGVGRAFLVLVCNQALKQAELAQASGDVVLIVRAYAALKEIQS